MKFLKQLFSGVTAVALACSLYACGTDDEDNLDPGTNGSEEQETPETGNPQQWVFPTEPGDWAPSSEEAKTMVDGAASTFMNNFRPSDQSRLINLVGAFVENYGEYEFYDGDDDYDDYYHSRSVSAKGVRSFFSALKSAVIGSDLMSLSRAALNTVTFGDFTGIYEPDDRSETFLRTGDSNSLIIRFYIDGSLCELSVSTVGSGSWNLDVPAIAEAEVDRIVVPDHIRFNLTEAGTSLAFGDVKTKWIDNSSLSVDATACAANIVATALFNSSNTKATATECLFVDDKQVMETRAEVYGSNMVSSEALLSLVKEESYTWGYGDYTYTDYWYEYDTEAAVRMLHSAKASAMIDGGLIIDASVPSISAFGDLNDGDFDWYEYNFDQNAALADCEAFCAKLNQGADVNLRFSDTAHFATLKWRPRVSVNSYDTKYWWIEPEGVIAFEDGTTYAVDEYAKVNFTGIESRFNSLLRAYVALINAAF